ncbi:MAG: antitoxin Xre-like helix-turn-helix domain-containing protein [Panacibacter sp.]
MAKSTKPVKYNAGTEKPVKAEEPYVKYRTVKKLPDVADFSYRKFEKIAKMMPFTQKEWANILHLSDRTLQRYSKDNANFEGIYTDRILHVEQLIKAGLETFINAEAFYNWLKKEKMVMGTLLNFESLYSARGIQELTDQLGRIQHGVYS